MKARYETTTKIGTGIIAKEDFDVIEIMIGDQEITVSVRDVAELYEVLGRVKEDTKKYPDEFDLV